MNSSGHEVPLFPKVEKAPSDYFTGTVWLTYLVSGDDTFNTIAANVIFESGARTHWHAHPGGQILIVTEGLGYYQEKGKPIQLIRKGDIVKIAPEIIHWHGASPDKELSHIAINTNTQKGMVNWMQEVTNEEYGSWAEK